MSKEARQDTRWFPPGALGGCRSLVIEKENERLRARLWAREKIEVGELHDLLRRAAAKIGLPQFARSRILERISELVISGEV